MKKMLQFTGVIVLVLVMLYTMSLKNNLSLLTWDMTPEKWLETHSHIVLKTKEGTVVLAEPSSSIIVFSLGVILGFAGFSLLKDEIKDRKSGMENYSIL
ncbi:MAG: hypothetical protein ACK4MM_04090 [Fervidobacterium sp.]